MMTLLWASVIFAANAALADEFLSSEHPYGHAALIAHVRVAGKVEFTERTSAYFVEVIDAARGSLPGQIAIVGSNSYEEERRLDWKPGEEFILFAKHGDDGMYQPLPFGARTWKVERGIVAESESMRALIPPASSPVAANIVAQLRRECRVHQVRLRVRLNARDVAAYQGESPLRVEIAIENAGETSLRFQNNIEYHFKYQNCVDAERLRDLRKEMLSEPVVKLCVQPLERLRLMQALEQMAYESRRQTLAPGQRATATFDLNDEYDVRGGGKFLVWAELGPHRSPPVVLDLPQRDEALREVEAMELLEVADYDGPFRIQPHAHRRSTSAKMPPVGPTVETAAIEAALSWWFKREQPRRLEADDENPEIRSEIAVLRSTNIHTQLPIHVPGVYLAVTDIGWRNVGQPVRMQTAGGPAAFHWRCVEIESVEVRGQRATVKVRQNWRRSLGGSGAEINMRRIDGRWRVDDEILLWQS